MEFRTLKANEIDCRISTINQKGLSLLLYKDARVDQNILDETVGPMNWMRHHSRDNANCTVSIWDEEKKQWIEKEDTGTESYTEKEKGEPLFVVILDGITDPHNLGSIIRSAECVGAHGVIIPQRRAVGVSETVVKVSAGATEHVNVVKVTNVNDTIRELKDRGVYVFSTAMDGEPMYKANLTGDVAIVIGSEGDGVKRLTKELSDGVISIPQYGKLNSLNAGVAAGIVMFEKARQEKFGK